MLIIRCFVLLCSCALVLSARAQASVIVNAIDQGDYIVIPPAALRSDVVGIVYQMHPFHKATSNNIPIEFFWNSVCTDGQYRVTVTPEQVYFSDGHENPNPSRLYWVIAITRMQYAAIKRALAHQQPSGFLDISQESRGSSLLYKSRVQDLTSFPGDWTGAQYDAYCDAARNKHLAAIFKLFNAALVATGSPLRQPIQDTPRFFSFIREEIFDWLPQPDRKP